MTAIDPIARTVDRRRSQQGYDKLLLATGARPRHLPMADDSGAPVTYLRTVEDSDRIKSQLRLGRRLVVVGGGWIGLEVAAAARSAGAHVTVLEALDLPLVRVLGPEVASIFAALHTAHGVDLRVNTKVSSIEGDDGMAIVRLADGSSVEADLLVVGIGAVPETRPRRGRGAANDNGIVVDEQLRTSEPDIFAAGDVANAYHPLLGRHLRVEHWDNAIEQGVVAAQNMLGKAVSYDRLPYFYSDQYDLGMEYLGNVGPDGYDQVVLRGKPAEGTFTAFWLREGRVLAGMHANDWDAMDPIRKIVGAHHGVRRPARRIRVPGPDRGEPRLSAHPSAEREPPRPGAIKRLKKGSTTMSRLTRLHEEQGQSPWLDNLTRPYLQDATLFRLIIHGVRGVTANPTIVAKAIESSDAYDKQFHRLMADGHSVEDAYWHLVITDVVDALRVLRPTFDLNGGGDGFVSIEVAPECAHDTEATKKAARDLHERIGEPNLLVKIPATTAGRTRHRGHDRGRTQHQRDSDLLPGPVRPGHRGLPVWPGDPGPPRRGSLGSPQRGLVLREPGRQRGRPPSREAGHR